MSIWKAPLMDDNMEAQLAAVDTDDRPLLGGLSKLCKAWVTLKILETWSGLDDAEQRIMLPQ